LKPFHAEEIHNKLNMVATQGEVKIKKEEKKNNKG